MNIPLTTVSFCGHENGKRTYRTTRATEQYLQIIRLNMQENIICVWSVFNKLSSLKINFFSHKIYYSMKNREKAALENP
jgi:hypothetical protein